MRRLLPPAATLQRLRACWRNGGVLAYPTESCFGLGCDPRNVRGLRRLLRLKRRSACKGMIVVAASLEQLHGLIRPLTPEHQRIVRQTRPEPTTFVVPAASGALPGLRGRHRQLAVRITTHRPTLALCRILGPLVSTSANRAGQPACTTARHCRRIFGQRITLADTPTGPHRKPSRIVELLTGKILRA
jgi:L-threonylcarbamoyladenylate synthase